MASVQDPPWSRTGGFDRELVVPVTLVMPNGRVLAQEVARAGVQKLSVR